MARKAIDTRAYSFELADNAQAANCDTQLPTKRDPPRGSSLLPRAFSRIGYESGYLIRDVRYHPDDAYFSGKYFAGVPSIPREKERRARRVIAPASVL